MRSREKREEPKPNESQAHTCATIDLLGSLGNRTTDWTWITPQIHNCSQSYKCKLTAVEEGSVQGFHTASLLIIFTFLLDLSVHATFSLQGHQVYEMQSIPYLTDLILTNYTTNILFPNKVEDLGFKYG